MSNTQHEIISFLFFMGIWDDKIPTTPFKTTDFGLETKAKAVIEAQRAGLRHFIVFQLTSGWGYTDIASAYADSLDESGFIFPGVEPITWCEYNLDKNKIKVFTEPQTEDSSPKKSKIRKKKTFINVDDL